MIQGVQRAGFQGLAYSYELLSGRKPFTAPSYKGYAEPGIESFEERLRKAEMVLQGEANEECKDP